MFANEKNVHCFGMVDEIAAKENFINEETLKNAKVQHNYYAQKYGGETLAHPEHIQMVQISLSQQLGLRKCEK
ncbi:MAG: hypothetical protein ACI4RH_11985 [Huintestinicola sp.]